MSNSSMNLTCEVVLPCLSFRVRSLNFTRAVGFAKTTEGPGKDIGLARWTPGHRTREAALPCTLPSLSQGSAGRPGGCLTGCIPPCVACQRLTLCWALALHGRFPTARWRDDRALHTSRLRPRQLVRSGGVPKDGHVPMPESAPGLKATPMSLMWVKWGLGPSHSCDGAQLVQDSVSPLNSNPLQHPRSV